MKENAKRNVFNDSRLRLEYKLREADLIHSDYAREIMQLAKPPREPRRDTISTIFRYKQLVDD